MRLLLVEDDEMLAATVQAYLTRNGFAVDHFSSARQAQQMGLQETYKAAILDIGLPDGSGLDVLRAWRNAHRSLPVLLLTARSDWQDKVSGLKAGADDYLAKPFHIEELVARINALIRRGEGRMDSRIEAGGVELDEDRQQVRVDDGEWRALTATEFRLLRCLISRPGRILSKRELVEQLYDIDSAASDNTVEAYIYRIRALIGKDRIKTLRGQGYSFRHNA